MSSCGQKPLVARRIGDEFEYGPDDGRIKVVAQAVPVLDCPACGEPCMAPKLHSPPSGNLPALGILTPGQIKALRERLGRDQAEFARIDWHRCGHVLPLGTRQPVADAGLDRYLRLLDACLQAVNSWRPYRSRLRHPLPSIFLR